MLKLEVSKLPYGRTLTHIGNILVGVVFICGIIYYDPHFRDGWTQMQTANGWLFSALGIAILIASYIFGSLVLLVTNILLAHMWNLGQAYAIKHKNPKESETHIPDTWKNLTIAMLSRVGVPPPSEAEWSDWFRILYGFFVQENRLADATKYGMLFSVGLLFIGFMLRYREARTFSMATFATVAIISVLYKVWHLGRTYAEFRDSRDEQQVGMLRLLLETANTEASQKEKASGKAAGAN